MVNMSDYEEQRKEMRLDEVVLNLKGSIGSTAVQDGSFSRVQIPQAQCSAASEEQRNVGLSTYQFTLTHTRKKKHTKRLIKTRWMDHTYWFADPKVFPENPKNIKNKYTINLVIVTASGKKKTNGSLTSQHESHDLCAYVLEVG